MLKSEEKNLNIRSRSFGSISGEELFIYTLSNGVVDVEVTNFGGIIKKIATPDRHFIRENIVAGFDNLEPYIDDRLYLGCLIGRHSNRIRNGKFSIDGIPYQLSINNDGNHLHGGVQGFNKKVWQQRAVIDEPGRKGIIFSYFSSEGEEGYPGNAEFLVSYILTSDNELVIHYQATTDRPTIISLTNHSYFNLSGFSEPTIGDHQLSVESDRYLVTEQNLPTGEIAPVENTLFDFRKGVTLSSCLHDNVNGGLNHCFELHKNAGLTRNQICLSDPKSGRVMYVRTDQPAIQVYTSNEWDGTVKNELGTRFDRFSAIALETQAFTDAPNHPHFPSSVVYPGQRYDTTTIYQFDIE